MVPVITGHEFCLLGQSLASRQMELEENMNMALKQMSFKATDSLAEQIAQHLGQKVIQGEWKAGERLQELRIAEELQVSRGSVREAFLIMERRHLIDILPRKGAVVSELSEKHVKGIYEMMVVMLSLLAEKAALNWQEGDLPEFMGFIEKMRQFIENHQVLEFHEASFYFATMAYRFSDNPFIPEVLDDLYPSIKRAYYLALNLEKEEMIKSHVFFADIMENVAQRNPAGAHIVIKKFGEYQCALVLNALRKSGSLK